VSYNYDPVNFLVGCCVVICFVVLGWFLINHQLDNENRRHLDQGRQMVACIDKVDVANKSDVQLCRSAVYGSK
jgi:hypothetical protein